MSQKRSHDLISTPLCKCEKEMPLLTVNKPTPNYGRQFYSCKTCNSFQWADQPTKKSDTVTRTIHVETKSQYEQRTFKPITEEKTKEIVARVREHQYAKHSKPIPKQCTAPIEYHEVAYDTLMNQRFDIHKLPHVKNFIDHLHALSTTPKHVILASCYEQVHRRLHLFAESLPFGFDRRSYFVVPYIQFDKTNNYAIVIELRMSNNEEGWLYSSYADYIVFELKNRYLVVNRGFLKEFVETFKSETVKVDKDMTKPIMSYNQEPPSHYPIYEHDGSRFIYVHAGHVRRYALEKQKEYNVVYADLWQKKDNLVTHQ